MFDVIWRIGVVAFSCAVAIAFSSCSSYGGEIRLGWVPINQLDATQSLKPEGKR